MALHGRALCTKLLQEQFDWINECGGDLAGYLAHYYRYGQSAETIAAIYRADTDELKRLKWRLVECR